MSRLQIFVFIIVMISAAAVITVRHESRLTFVALQKEETLRDGLQIEWGRLMLEKATWAGQHNIADTAKKNLTMTVPGADKIITLGLQSASTGENSAQ